MNPEERRHEGASFRSERLLMLGGIVFVAFVVAAVISAPELPSADAPIAGYAATYAEHRDGHILSTFLSGFAALAFFAFLGGLFSILRAAEGGTGKLSLLALGSGVAANLMILIAQAVYAAAATVAAVDGIEPGVVRGLDTIVPAMTLFGGFPRVVFLAAAATVILQTMAAPRWLAWFGLVVAAVNLIGAGGIFDVESIFGLFGFLGIVLFTAWILVTSIVLLRKSTERQSVSQLIPA